MKIMCVLGSPRKNGNTAKALSCVEHQLRADGHTVERVDVGKGQILPCLSCYGCKKTPDKPGCKVKDDGNRIFERMLKADAVVFASPLYCWGVSAQIKALLDRAYCLLKFDKKGYRSLLAGKRLALLVTGGSGLKDNLDLTVPPFREFTKFFKCKLTGTLLIPNCREPKDLGAAVQKKARALAKKVAG